MAVWGSGQRAALRTCRPGRDGPHRYAARAGACRGRSCPCLLLCMRLLQSMRPRQRIVSRAFTKACEVERLSSPWGLAMSVRASPESIPAPARTDSEARGTMTSVIRVFGDGPSRDGHRVKPAACPAGVAALPGPVAIPSGVVGRLTRSGRAGRRSQSDFAVRGDRIMTIPSTTSPAGLRPTLIAVGALGAAPAVAPLPPRRMPRSGASTDSTARMIARSQPRDRRAGGRPVQFRSLAASGEIRDPRRACAAPLRSRAHGLPGLRDRAAERAGGVHPGGRRRELKRAQDRADPAPCGQRGARGRAARRPRLTVMSVRAENRPSGQLFASS